MLLNCQNKTEKIISVKRKPPELIHIWARSIAFLITFLILNDEEEARFVEGRFPTDYSNFFDPIHIGLRAWGKDRIWTTIQGAVLASPLNNELANALHTQMTQFGVNGHIFLGTHDLYSKGHFASIEGVPLSDMEIKWGARGADTADCLTLFSHNGTEYHMSTSSCEDPRPFICYRKLDNLTTNECGTFDDEYHYRRYTGSCYKVHHKIQTWTRAYGICASEGGHLVILDDKEEARIVKDMFPARTTYTPPELWDCFHVGLGAWGKERTWTTIHGKRFEDVFNDNSDKQPYNLWGIQRIVHLCKETVVWQTLILSSKLCSSVRNLRNQYSSKPR